MRMPCQPSACAPWRSRSITVRHAGADKGGNLEVPKESQRRRYADEGAVEKVVQLDEEWRKGACLRKGWSGVLLRLRDRPSSVGLDNLCDGAD